VCVCIMDFIHVFVCQCIVNVCSHIRKRTRTQRLNCV
jgi:hypothetical protein